MKNLSLLILSLTCFSAFAGDDLYPEIAASEAKLHREYDSAAEAFATGDQDADRTFAAIAPNQYKCAYYMQNHRRKDDAPLDISKASLSKNGRSITLLKTRANLAKSKDSGPFAYLDVKLKNEDWRYRVEVRLARNEYEGFFAVQVIRGRDAVERNLDTPQYLICPLE